MNFKSIAVAAALTIATLFSATAAEKIQFDPGGSLSEYSLKYLAGRNGETQYEIDGVCISACTLITAFVPKKNVCTTDIGLLAFHSATSTGTFGREHSSEGTRLMWNLYPIEVRTVLKDLGWDATDGSEHGDLIYVPASKFYRTCG